MALPKLGVVKLLGVVVRIRLLEARFGTLFLR